ncbi:hypothetical protein EFO61_13655 [Lacticaseibacillus rhamnosus]|nr:hypothetical protein BVH57_11075 [Lacticaseibacillus rhamnosus]MCT3146118.1 hypothetical protein [Lacticaseibacillus rhamnosus]MCT3152770.1 hypothetical protein [Lacticaseibacillus rhamnosus]MCT3162983.1 hypothetical protein [Lacticaseibacillus rhamnosus]MCT3165676.1 hypothetical protein [Lacticaseibacillus rhamnosus]
MAGLWPLRLRSLHAGFYAGERVMVSAKAGRYRSDRRASSQFYDFYQLVKVSNSSCEDIGFMTQRVHYVKAMVQHT